MSFADRSKKEGGEQKTESHRCGFCPTKSSGKVQYAYGFCATYFPIGTTPGFAICGPTTGRNCFQQHCNGVEARHSMQK